MRISEGEMQVRRKRFIKVAFKLFCKHGIAQVSMEQIAKTAQISENTIYRYFDNKETLVQEAFFRLWDTIMQKVERSVEGVADYHALTGYEQVHVWIEAFRRLYEENKEFIVFSYEAKLYLLRRGIKLDGVSRDVLPHSLREPFIAALNKGKEDGSIAATADSEDLFYALWGAIHGYIVKIVIYGQLAGEDSPWESRYDVLERGVLCSLHNGCEAAGR